MERRARDARSPRSDTDGSEDVFLDLADEPEASRDRHGQETGLPQYDKDEQDEDRTLRNIPGQYPDRQPLPHEESRPRSSDYLSSVSGEVTERTTRAQHVRHVSQPNGGLSYLNNLSALRHNRQIASRSSGVPNTNYDSPLTSWSQMETPRLRRQQRLYANTDGYTEGRLRYENADTEAANVGAAQPIASFAADPAAPNDSDSVDSQTAASTVWDELDDLKSRIKRLEGPGRRQPSTANTAIANHAAARPQTATTAPTTVSSSPRQVRKQLPAPSEVLTGPTAADGVHPTLQAALARASTSVKPHVYRPLEAAVMDALTMATVTGRQPLNNAMSSAASTLGPGTSDRQMRRKVDSLCRNLADLCIAVCDSRSEEMQVSSSPTSARRPQQASPRHYVRQSVEVKESIPEVPAMENSRRGSRTSWARPDESRTPRMSISGRHDLLYSDPTEERSPSTVPRDYTARYSSLGRSDSQMHERRPSIADNGDSSMRAPSRAMTDAGRLGFGGRREQLQSGTGRSPSLRETLASRRRSGHYGHEEMADSQSTISASDQTPAARRFLERTRGGPAEVVSGTPAMRSRLGSHEYQPASPRLTTPLGRTSSLNQRRFAT